MTPYLAALIGAGTIATAPTRPGEADFSRDRLSSIVGPTSTSSRSADQAARAGRSASELARIRAPLARARECSEMG